ncbi:MAG: PD-(D/E)XK nuclease family protein [Akkermansiaceae bacterium]|nr:PD-(D/E)XK nuclease family protein [Akkermansiaceae bacterium]
MGEELELGLFEEDRRVFLGWQRPLLLELVDWLWERREELPGMVLVVPTAQSGRRLREFLAERGGCLAPRVVTPGYFMRAEGTASEAIELLAWVEVLEGVKDWTRFAAAFPIAPGEGEAKGWAMGLAKSLAGVRTSLQESALTMAGAAKWMKGTVEAERWNNLAALEDQVERMMGGWQVTSRSAALSRGGFSWPAELKKVVVAGVADLPKAVSRILEQAPVPVSVVVAAEEGNDFDDWGRPGEGWSSRGIAWPELGSVNLVADPREQAEAAVRLVAEAGTASDQVALGSADEETSGELVRVFGRRGWEVFDPGRRVAPVLTGWLGAWRNYLRHPGVAEVGDLLGFAQSGALVRGRRAQRAVALSEARDAWLVRSREDVERATKSAKGDLEQARKEGAESFIKRGEFAVEQLGVLEETLGNFEDSRGRFLGDGFHRGMEGLLGVVDTEDESGMREWIALTEPLADQVKRDAVFWIDLFLASPGMSAEAAPEDRVLDVLGWVELLFEPGPHLVVCGMNEGMVPARESTDAWLPEGTRRVLGLSHGETRAARDAYLLTTMLKAREVSGRSDLLMAKASGSGDALLPSRLLLAAEGKELARRVQLLFREVEPPGAGLAWTLEEEWRWQPRVEEGREKLSVTAFSDYLACPFRFYLKQVLRMGQTEPERVEWNARDFGTVAHIVLERWALDEKARDFSKPEAIEEWVHAELDRVVAERFGDDPPLAVRIQVESMRQRLSWFARVQACERAAGWRVVEVEKRFSLDLDGIEVRGQVDRIEVNDDGRKRILDYKTTASAKEVEKAHLTKIVASTKWPEHLKDVDAVKSADGKMRWINLQIALYSAALGDVDEIGYFALGATEADVAISIWNGFGGEERESAMGCARWVVGEVKAGKFWPPTEKVKYEDYEALGLGRGLDETVAWKGGGR